jgi:ABC-type transport system involved in multi-copper enzyme maturation permease subunit
MIAAYRSEWIKLVRRGMFLTGGVITAIAALGAGIGVTRARSGGAAEGFSVARLAQPDGFLQLMSRANDILLIFAIATVATAVAIEYQQGTLRNLLVRQPDRMRLLAGKLAALTTWLAIVLLLASGAAMLSAVLTAPSRGIDTSMWFNSAGIGNTLGAVGGTVLAGVCGGLIGASLGLAVRSVAPSIVAGIAWILPIESLLVVAFTWLKPYLPGQAIGAISAGGTDVLPLTHAVATASVWIVGLMAIAAVLFRTRDVAA